MTSKRIEEIEQIAHDLKDIVDIFVDSIKDSEHGECVYEEGFNALSSLEHTTLPLSAAHWKCLQCTSYVKFDDGRSPLSNKWDYCPYCGREIKGICILYFSSEKNRYFTKYFPKDMSKSDFAEFQDLMEGRDNK
jgi:hypothetical protein